MSTTSRQKAAPLEFLRSLIFETPSKSGRESLRLARMEFEQFWVALRSILQRLRFTSEEGSLVRGSLVSVYVGITRQENGLASAAVTVYPANEQWSYVRGAQITLVGTGSGGKQFVPRAASVGRDGGVIFADLPAGEYRLHLLEAEQDVGLGQRSEHAERTHEARVSPSDTTAGRVPSPLYTEVTALLSQMRVSTETVASYRGDGVEITVRPVLRHQGQQGQDEHGVVPVSGTSSAANDITIRISTTQPEASLAGLLIALVEKDRRGSSPFHCGQLDQRGQVVFKNLYAGEYRLSSQVFAPLEYVPFRSSQRSLAGKGILLGGVGLRGQRRESRRLLRFPERKLPNQEESFVCSLDEQPDGDFILRAHLRGPVPAPPHVWYALMEENAEYPDQGLNIERAESMKIGRFSLKKRESDRGWFGEENLGPHLEDALRIGPQGSRHRLYACVLFGDTDTPFLSKKESDGKQELLVRG